MAAISFEYDEFEQEQNEKEIKSEIKRLKKHIKKLARRIHGSVLQRVARYFSFDTFSQLEINHSKRKIEKLQKQFELYKIQRKM